ncbi:hypothetical protein [Paenibacillus tundrae]|uniref:hypothetical protein n=1 Tax=Paenibacillus tundrae TaxID=528187 RepID=UPI0030CF7CDB
MRWRSEALAFDTRWLPCIHTFRQRGATAIVSAPDPGATNLRQPLLTFSFLGVMPKVWGVTPSTPFVRGRSGGIWMRWRSEALAFDTRWLPCIHTFRPPRSNSDRMRT